MDVPDFSEVKTLLNKTEEAIIYDVHMVEDMAHLRPGQNLVIMAGPHKVVNKVVATNTNSNFLSHNHK